MKLTDDEVRAYLDEAIRFWRYKWADAFVLDYPTKDKAAHYIDAFQSVRMSLFGELLEDER